ncbi:MAG: TrmB family transcriptional regulator [Promethearchaeota archaeon]
MQKLGSFTVNDSRIYTTLLLIGLSSPAKISEKSHVDRARVYDSLKRLVKRGIVEEEPVPRAPRYKAVPPEIVFGKIVKKFKTKITLAEKLETELVEIQEMQPLEKNLVWTIQGEKKIKKQFKSFLEEATEFCNTILTIDYSPASLREFEQITQWILDKLRRSDIKIRVAMKIIKDQKAFTPLINLLYHEDVEIYNWNAGSILPFGLVITDRSYIQTYLSSITPKPKYDYGVFMENASQNQISGLKHLSLWVFSHLCQKVAFTKRNGDTN